MSSIYTNGNDSYFYSNKIKVFPCAYRSNAYDATARLNTEYNFTHLPHMADKASYIIEFTSKKLICAIQGYYFEIELGTDDYGALNNNKYLNICVASPKPPEGTDFIEGPHLCSWDSSDSVEAILDGKPEGSNYYIFKGLKIGEGALSNGSYQCYALKLDASAKLPIMANKIENIIKNKDSVENGTGKPISQEFTTETLSATTSISTSKLSVASDKLTVTSGNITANVPVTINNTLEVKDSTATTSILKAESAKVTINKPTNIEGADSNLTVAGTGKFGGKLTVSSNGADITGTTDLKGTVGITGKTTIGSGSNKTEIENNNIKTSEITADKINIKKATEADVSSLVIDKAEKNNNIIKIKDKSDVLIFSVNTNSGAIYAKQINADNINATVEGTIDNAKKAEKVTTYIGSTNISSIFETNGSVARKASSITATSSNNSVGNTIITGNTTGTIDAIIPAKTEKTKDRTYNIGSSDKTFDNIYATTFHGNHGNFGGKLTVNGSPTGSYDVVRKTELDNTFWLSGGNGLPNNINLNNYTTVGNYFHMLAVGSNVTNLPTNADSAFTLKVTALANNDDGTPSFIQQQLRDVSGNIYTRTFTPTGEGVAATWSEWSLVLTSEACMSLPLTRDIAKKYMKIEEDPDFIIVSVNALIKYVRDNYVTDARIQVGDTRTSTSIYYGILIEGLDSYSLTGGYTPKLTEYIIHVDLKSRYGDAWITVEDIDGKTYQCFWNSAYDENGTATVSGNKPIWKMLPTTGNLNASVGKNDNPAVPTGNIGSASQPVYLTDGQLIASGAKIGGSNKPIYMNLGELTACGATIGGSNKPIWMNQGELVACTYAYTVTNTLPSELQADTIYFITED